MVASVHRLQLVHSATSMIMFHFFMSVRACPSSRSQASSSHRIGTADLPGLKSQPKLRECRHVDFRIALEGGVDVASGEAKPLETRLQARTDVVALLDLLGD